MKSGVLLGLLDAFSSGWNFLLVAMDMAHWCAVW